MEGEDSVTEGVWCLTEEEEPKNKAAGCGKRGRAKKRGRVCGGRDGAIRKKEEYVTEGD